ncbi:MAG: VRR-NUC domain-containing protein [Planctomycetaceae bacterium]|nr:VRR-NUC domain-containing protein [Planctomycetaceae bacterium]
MSLRASDVFRTTRARQKPEREVQRAILGYLRSIGALVAVTDAGAAYRAGSWGADTVPAGWPDITGLLPDGRFIGVECKAPGGRQSPVQKFMEQEIEHRCGLYVLACSIDDVREAIERDG